jgi:hypothetical protein
MAKQEPELLWIGLNHTQLAARIKIANMLQEKYGPDFKYDPWETSARRAAVIIELKKKWTAPVDSTLPEK